MSQEYSRNVRHEFSKNLFLKSTALTRKLNDCCITDEYPDAIHIIIPRTITSIGNKRQLVTKDKTVVDKEDQRVKIPGLCRLVEIGSR